MSNTNTVSPSQVKSAFAMLQAVAEAIRSLGSVPSGTLYAQLMSKIDLPTYTKLIDTLKGAGLVKESGHLLTWVEPAR